MNQLIEGMLSVGARLAPIDGPGVATHRFAFEGYMLAVALHGELLQVRRKALEILLVGQHGERLRAEEIVVPDGEQPEEHRQVALKRRGAKVLVHAVEAIEHRAKMLRPDGERSEERRVGKSGDSDCRRIPQIIRN